jgi:hypothetical protein
MKGKVGLGSSCSEKTLRLIDRMLIATLVTIVSVTSVFSQSQPVIQTGFAAVRPIVGTGAGLMLFGRVEHRNGDEVFQTTIWANSVVTITSLVVNSNTTAGQDTGIAIANPTNFIAEITLTLRNNQGIVVASRTIVVNALHQISRFVSDLFGVTTTGLLTITSTAPIALVGVQFDGASFSLVPTNGPQGATALLLPQIATGGGWSTEVVIANGTGLEQTIDIDFYNQDGVIVATEQNIDIPPGGVILINR